MRKIKKNLLVVVFLKPLGSADTRFTKFDGYPGVYLLASNSADQTDVVDCVAGTAAIFTSTPVTDRRIAQV